MISKNNCFKDIDWRSNYLKYTFNEKNVIIYDSHRCILNVIYSAFQENFISRPVNVISFDYHEDDDIPVEQTINKIREIRKQQPNIKDFWSFVEFTLKSSNDNWLIAGMELGIINNAIIIGAKRDYDGWDDYYEYTDHLGKSHEIYKIPHLRFSLGRKGCLGDSSLEESYKRIRRIFGYNIDGDSQWNDINDTPFILDFDLDYFSFNNKGTMMAWSRNKFDNEMEFKVSQKMTPRIFIDKLILRSAFITIARESFCCGGIGESNKILRMIDKHFFHNELHTLPIL